MNLDTFIEIGSSHQVCEDYIIKGDDPIPYIILSDGCSSSEGTEMGARILCHLAKQYLKYRPIFPIVPDELGLWVIHNAELIARQLGLKLSCLDATLIVSYEVNNLIYVHMYGDGCVINKNEKETTIDYFEYKSPSNKSAPFYLSYQIDMNRRSSYYNMQNIKTKITISSDGINQSTTENNYTIDLVPTYIFNALENSSIMITSDGLLSFCKKINGINKDIVLLDIVNSITDFKSFSGPYLQRRMIRQMKNYFSEDIHHYDDLSIGSYLKEKGKLI